MTDESGLQRSTLSVIELWHRQRSQQRISDHSNAIIGLVDLLEAAQKGWRDVSRENTLLTEENARLSRQLENYSEALEESRENTRRMEGDLAAANAKIESLQAELTQHQLLFQAASDELKNVTIRRSTLLRQNELTEDPSASTNRRRTKRYAPTTSSSAATMASTPLETIMMSPGVFKANEKSILGPVVWTPSTPKCEQVQKSKYTPTTSRSAATMASAPPESMMSPGAFKADDKSLLGPVVWTPSTPKEAQVQKSKLVTRLARNAPLFDRPY